MLKRREKLVIKLSLLTMCASLLPTTLAFADIKDVQGNVKDIIKTTGESVSVSYETTGESNTNSKAETNMVQADGESQNDVDKLDDKSNQKTIINAVQTTGEEVSVSDESDFSFDSSTGAITGYNGKDTDVIIPSKINGVLVTGIEDNAFWSKNEITSITIPETVTSIGYAAFSECSNLSRINIPKGVTEIEADTFSGCDSLTSVTIPSGVTDIGDCAFSRSGLKNVNIPSTVTRIGKGAFKECSLTSINIPQSVTSIEEDTFRGCRGLTSITIPGSVKTIGKSAFLCCEGAKSITILEGVENIGEQAFSQCSTLETITIPNSVTTIGTRALEYCSKLKNITIPNSVKSIGQNAFVSCKSLTDITIPASVESIGTDTFNNCSKLKGITVDDNNKNYSSVDGVLFNKDKTKILRYPEGKEDVNYTIPETVTSIEDYAFYYNNNLVNISIPEGMTSLGDNTFRTNDTGIKYYVKSENVKQLLIKNGIDESQIIVGDKSSTVSVTDIKLNETSFTLAGGETKKLVAEVLPSDASNKSVTWSTSNRFVAEVGSDGEVQAICEGTATITCTSRDGSNKSVKCVVTVTAAKPVKVEDFKLSETHLELTKGNKASIYVSFTPVESWSYADTKWSSSDEKVAKVEDGEVTAISNGTATLTCTLMDGSNRTKTCEVIVTGSENGTNVELDKTQLKMKKGETEKLTATVSPDIASDSGVTWSSSNENVARVDMYGNVKAIANGNAIITCTANDGSDESATCKVSVAASNPIYVTDVELNKTYLNLVKGNTEKLKVTVSPSNAKNKKVTWSSSNTKVAKVDSNGKVTAVGKGTAIITCTSKDGSDESATCKVKVINYVMVTDLELNKTHLELKKGKTSKLKVEVLPSNAKNKELAWSSSNTKVVKVDSNGNVTAVGKGTAIITCKSKDGSDESVSCKITVTK